MQYEPKDLKKQFPELRLIEDFVLVPLLDTAFYSWIKYLPVSRTVSDVQKRDSSDLFDPREVYTCVVHGRVVEVHTDPEDIDALDDDEWWFVVGSIRFEGAKDGAKVLLESFKGFIEEYELEEFLRRTKKRLRNGKTYHLSDDMHAFYFGGKEDE